MQRSLDTLFWDIGKGMVADVDYYAVLEIAETASDEEIKQSYRRLAKKYHPDLNPDDTVAEEKFKNVAKAYAVLGDAQKKKEYDAKRMGERKAKKHSVKTQVENIRKSSRNPLDTTDMFEAFMGFK